MKLERRSCGAGLALLGLFLVHAPAARAQCTPQETAILAGSSIGAGDEFGHAVAVSGDTVVVGAHHTAGTGTAYVFARDHGGPNAWGEVAVLTPSDGEAGDEFGVSVAVSGDTIVVGSWLDDDAGLASGSAYVFQRDFGGASNWGEVVKLTAADAEALDGFGISVALSGGMALVGSRLDDDNGDNSGSAYAYQSNHGGTNNWGELQKLKPLDGAAGDFFGHAVALHGNVAVVGALYDQDGGTGAGSAYVFELDQGLFAQTAKLLASDGAGGDLFGFSVTVSGDTIAAGAIGDDHTVNDAGSAYLFGRGPGGWGEVAKVTASDPGNNAGFGRVALNGDVLLSGAPRAGTDGQAYVFFRDQNGVDQWGQMSVVMASNGMGGDSFGEVVALSGGTAIVGAPDQDTWGNNAGMAYLFDGVSTVAGPQEIAKLMPEGSGEGFTSGVAISGDVAVIGAFADGSYRGSAYVFERHEGGNGNWGRVTKLLASDGGPSDWFGASVAISGDRIVVGAPYADDDGPESGSSYVFERNHGGVNNWGEVTKLTASDADYWDNFGWSVAVSGTTIVVGAEGDEDPGGISLTGSAYVFERDHGGANNWGEVKKLLASDGAGNDRFACDLQLDGDNAVIGAYGDDDNGAWSGSAYIFQRHWGGANNWGEVTKLVPSDGGAEDRFAGAVGISADTVVGGAILHGNYEGAVYVFERDTGGANNWGETHKLVSSDIEMSDRFGQGVDVSGDVILVGAEKTDVLGFDSGSAYVFQRDHGSPGAWGEVAQFTASNGAANDYFGYDVALSGLTGVVAAWSAQTAYVFEPLHAVPPTTYCTAGVSASGCQAQIAASGTPSATATSGFDLIAMNVEGDKKGIFFFGANGRQANAWGNGTSYQCVVPPVKRGALLDGGGTASTCDGQFVYDLNARWSSLPNQNPGAGALIQAQLWYRDPFNTSNRSTSLSNAIEFSVCP